MIFANVRALLLRDVRVIWDTTVPPQDRHAIYAGRVEDLSIEGFAGGPSAASLAAIGLESARRVITGARPSPGTPVFLGVNDVSEQEVVLTGNDI